MRQWLNAGETILMELVGDKARQVLIAIGGIDNPDAVQSAVDMFHSAVVSDQNKQKKPVETPVIPNAVTEETRAAVEAQRSEEAFIDEFLWAAQRNAEAHDHSHQIDFDDCDLCYVEAEERLSGARQV